MTLCKFAKNGMQEWVCNAWRLWRWCRICLFWAKTMRSLNIWKRQSITC